MKIIEIDEALYQHIAAQAQYVNESTSDILRRLLLSSPLPKAQTAQDMHTSQPVNTAPNLLKSPEPLLEASDDTAESAVENSAVLVEQETALFDEDINSNQPLETEVPLQTDDAIQQTVDRVRQLLNSVDFQQESTAVNRFLALLTALYHNNSDSFAQAIAQEASQGRSRTYFARDEATLLAAGNHTKPKPIPNTPYWVITNTNSARKMLMLERTMQFMQLPESLINEIRTYFTVD